ncbi:putative Kef-type K+ transport system, membrane component [Candidatus Desulfarcum epimagneticum]|uniref:Putative Kef-type K+ transport system, membrane component n=1 Tax=uncultured Desulfobacteraceae bacterium TaxID=218296 RepID=A0A484HE83_9BACT|nr:putative Kef-type K+ transport system, membrane component [uncultured Desulfobacteraceae bacterium]
MNPLWILAAFIFGAVVSRIGLPPLVGYLLAGFALNSIGVTGGETLKTIADAGVTLLLFTIGLKLKIKSLAKPEIWAGASIHMMVTVAVFGVVIQALAFSGAPLFGSLTGQTALLIAFALSFSSTVFAVKTLEEKKEMASRHAAVAIGILIMQDIIAVVFLAASTGNVPSAWAPLLFVSLFIARPVLGRLMAMCGHGELLMLFGILMTVAGHSGFELVGLKGDLGALLTGMLFASHPKARELADRLLGFKDLFLIGFFLNIGISGSPTPAGLIIALALALVMPLKTGLFLIILTRFKLRVRTSLLASLSLSNYSEFGLIVASIGVANGWISAEWLVTLAIALSMTFIMAAPLNAASHSIYARMSGRLHFFETSKRLPEDEPIYPGDAEIAILGMGGVGASAYDEMRRRYGDIVIGVDFNPEEVSAHRKKGRRVLYGDAEDSDFWKRIEPSKSKVTLVMLALPDPRTGVFSIQQMKERGYKGQITASVRYEDEIRLLKDAGVDAVYSLYEEAGVGFADHVCAHMDYCKLKHTTGLERREKDAPHARRLGM